MPTVSTDLPDDSPLPGTPASPCVGVCRLDRVRQDCLGCRRTLQEIAAWRDLDDAARQQVLDAAAARRAALGTGQVQPGTSTGEGEIEGGGIE